MESIPPVVLLLSCDAKNEDICELRDSIIAEFPNQTHEHTKQIKILNCEDLFENVDEDVELDVGKAMLKLKKIIQPTSKNKGNIHVYLLHDYPVSVGHFIGMIENSVDHPILDGVIKLVSKPVGSAIR